MKYYLVYQFEFFSCRIYAVPEGQHLDDIAGKYFTMDHGKEDGDGSIKGAFDSLEEAKAEALKLLEADKKKVANFEITINTATVEPEYKDPDDY